MSAGNNDFIKVILIAIFWGIVIGWLLGLSSEERHKALDWADPGKPVYTDPEVYK